MSNKMGFDWIISQEGKQIMKFLDISYLRMKIISNAEQLSSA